VVGIGGVQLGGSGGGTPSCVPFAAAWPLGVMAPRGGIASTHAMCVCSLQSMFANSEGSMVAGHSVAGCTHFKLCVVG
jgi:hypothetical protein